MRTEVGWLLDETAPGPRKPLYVRGSTGLKVTLDGPALCIRRTAKAVVWYPLARVARVVSSGAVQWDCEALLGCAEAGAPVVFLHRDGTVRAYLHGNARSRDPHDLLYTRLRARLIRSGGMARYTAWRRAMIDAAIQGLGRQMRESLASYPEAHLQHSLMQTRRRYAGAVQAMLIEQRIRGLLAGLSAQVLEEVGLGATRWPKLELTVDLAGDLAELLGWALEWPVLEVLQIRFGGGPAPDLIDEAQCIGWFEGQAAELRRLGLEWLNQLRQWLET